jgi:uncharacterized membrane protein
MHTLNVGPTLLTTFLASCVEAIEMVTIVVGVGAVRGWRSTLIGAGCGFCILAVASVALGTALTAIPIDVLRAGVGLLLLVFGLQWLRKGVRRVAARGFAGDGEGQVEADTSRGRLGIDWTSFVLAFKGVLLEGFEIAFIVVTFGSASNDLRTAAIGGVSALVLVGLAGVIVHAQLSRIPRSVLMLVVGVLLSTFGTFWSAEGLGARWPAGDLALIALVLVFSAAAAAGVAIARRGIFGIRPEAASA